MAFGNTQQIGLVQSQLTPDWRVYAVPVRGINSTIEEWKLQPQSGYAPLVKNFLPTLGGTLQKRKGFVELPGAGGTDHPVELFEFGDHKGKVHVLAVTHGKFLRQITAGASDAVNVTAYSDLTSLLTAAPGNVFFSLVEGSGKTFVYFTDDSFENSIVKHEVKYTNNVLETSNVTEAEAFDNPDADDDTTDGWSILNAKFLMSYNNFLILCNTQEQVNGETETNEYPYRFRWSNYGRPHDFRDTLDFTGGYIDLLEDQHNGPILTCESLRGAIVVYKSSSIHNVTLRSNGSFYTEIKVLDRGVVSSKAVAPVRNGAQHMVVSHDNMYLYDGFDLQSSPVGEKIKSFFYEERLDWEKVHTLYVKSFPTRNECWIFFDAKANSRLGLPPGREAICWNWERNSWTWHDLGLRCALSSTSLVPDGAAVTRSPLFLGGRSGTGAVRLFESFDDGGAPIIGQITFPLFFKVKPDGTNEPVRHAFEQTIFLQADMEVDVNGTADPSHYELYIRHGDNPLHGVSNTATDVEEARALVDDIGDIADVPWPDSDLIQFVPSQDVPPAYYQGLVLLAKSPTISEEISLVRFKTVDRGTW